MKQTAIYKTASGQQQVLAVYDSVLANWPLPYQTQVVPTRQGNTFVITCGPVNAPALILLHGAASNALSWRSEMSQYGKCFRVYAVDMVGEPGKSATNRPSWQDQSYAYWLEDVLTGLGIQKVSLVGLSQGGWAALRFATSYPHRVEKLVLLTPGGVVATKPGFILKAVVYSLFGRAGARAINRIVVGKQPLDATTIEFMNLIMTHFKARVEKEYLFTDAELSQLTMPVLVIGGTKDALRPSEAIATRLRQHVPHVESILLPGMGHVLVNQSSAIIPFLKANQ